MGNLDLPLPEEPIKLKLKTRTLLEQSPEEGQRLLAEGRWIATPLWKQWREALEPRGITRARFLEIVVGYRNELRLWVMGERPWLHCIAGLAGRLARRALDPLSHSGPTVIPSAAEGSPGANREPSGHRRALRPEQADQSSAS
ncbi:MAG TPA: hypothetical protein VKB09_01085 [Thermomicrobiales bacterium]|nr:hypothetical protein [Thermomicrobiales bacterium]